MGSSYTTAVGYDVAIPVTAPTVIAGTASGNMGVGIYTYKVTFITAFGETSTSPVSSNVTTGTGSVNLSNIPISTETNVTSRKLYRTTSGGGSWLFLATIADNTTTVYTDTASDGSLGVAAPTYNSAMSREIARGIFATSAPTAYSNSMNITAFAGGGQAGATLLTAENNRLAVVATAADSVVLPTLDLTRVGLKIVVRNSGANSANVFPAVGQFINALAVNTALAVAANATTTFIGGTANTWYTF